MAGLARKLGNDISRSPIPAAGNARDSGESPARTTQVRNSFPVRNSGRQSWKLVSTKRPGLQSFNYRFDFSNGLSATGIWLAGSSTPSDAPVTIIVNDKGYKSSAPNIVDHINRGEQVLALEPLFFGTTTPNDTDPAYWEMLVASSGDRPLGIQVAQLLAIAKSFGAQSGRKPVRLESEGIRSQIVVLAAAALEPGLFSDIRSNDVMDSLRFLLEAPVPYRTAPDLFCLDLYKYFDVDRLAILAAPVSIVTGRKAAAPPLVKN